MGAFGEALWLTRSKSVNQCVLTHNIFLQPEVSKCFTKGVGGTPYAHTVKKSSADFFKVTQEALTKTGLELKGPGIHTQFQWHNLSCLCSCLAPHAHF